VLRCVCGYYHVIVVGCERFVGCGIWCCVFLLFGLLIVCLVHREWDDLERE